MDEVKVTVIGAGVVGLAVAAELARCHHDVAVLERHESYGQETSSRNSEVIHAGIYYPAGSLKAALCVEGRELLYRFCREHSVPHLRTGKLIVAVEESEIAPLERLRRKGLDNGVEELVLLEKGEVARREPAVNAVAALHSPATGIVDSHTLMKRLHDSAQGAGALFAFGGEVAILSREKEGFVVGLAGDDYRLFSRAVVNCGGLSSDQVASLAGIDADAAGYRLRLVKGSYFSYARPSPVATLVYPLPHEDLAGLGVHSTLDLGGRLRFGPDTEDVSSFDYQVDPGRREAFFSGASRLIHGLEREAFEPGFAGIRPKLVGTGVRDFIIRHEADRGLPGLVNLVGIESPGLTACLAIARRVERLLAEYFC